MTSSPESAEMRASAFNGSPLSPVMTRVVEPASGGFRAAPVVRPRQQVENQIRQAILDGAFPQGERLPSEARLAEAFGVSRATVREALRALGESGLIVTTPGSKGGSFVQQVDHHALSNIVTDKLRNVLGLGSVTYDEVAGFRDLLEVPSARLAAQHRSEADLAAIRGIIDEEKGATHQDPRILTLNADFHTALATASGNRVLAAFVTALHRLAHPIAFVQTDPEVGRRAVQHHIAIHKAVQEQDPDRAAEAMRAHLRYLDEHTTD